MNKTGIEYLDYTWNPIAMRCTPVSEGCEHCWHLAMCKRLARNPSILFNEQMSYKGESPYLVRSRLDGPLKLKKPARIGVQFMGDLFHEDVRDTDAYKIHKIIDRCPQHTFIILTKRPKKALEMGWDSLFHPNVWLGISAENQQRADERIPVLLRIKAAVRFLSLEPLLGPIDLMYPKTIWPDGPPMCCNGRECGCRGLPVDPPLRILGGGKIDWVIIGGLSLPGGKIQPPKREWVDSIAEQCDEAGVPVFVKDNAQYPIERREFPG